MDENAEFHTAEDVQRYLRTVLSDGTERVDERFTMVKYPYVENMRAALLP